MNTTQHDNDTLAHFRSTMDTLGGKLDHLIMLLTVQMQLLREKPMPFTGHVPANGQYIGSRDAKGVVLCIHNPTASAQTVTLNDGGAALFSRTLAAGECLPTFLVFKNGLQSGGTTGGVILGGEYNR